MDDVRFRHCRPDDPVAEALIAELDAELAAIYLNACERHGLHPGEKQDPALRFFVIELNAEPVGCGAVRRLSATMAELKRMYVRPAFRRRGLSRRLVEFLERESQTNGVAVLRLETGNASHEALGLYASAGYQRIPAYGEYVGSAVSVCMEKSLQAAC